MAEVIVLFVFGMLFGIIYVLVSEKRQARRKRLDDDIPGFDDWRFGTPDDPLPDEAGPLDREGKNQKNNVLVGRWKGEEEG